LFIASAAFGALGLTAFQPAQGMEPSAPMPTEYAEVMAIVNQLASANDLGNQEIAFTIAVGNYGELKAEELGLCKEEKCRFYHSLNPFIQHKREVNEIIRQAYLYSDVNAMGHTNGTIEIPRVSFRLYGNNKDYMACTIAHEIAHARDAHTFTHSEKLSSQSGGMSEDDKKKLAYAINRDLELLADQTAWEMTTRAGYPNDICEKNLMFIHKSAGNGGITEPDSTHPGVQERIESLNAYALENKEKLETQKSTSGTWSYEPELNLLRFVPKNDNRNH
jgi:hypothetical protein